VLLKQSAILRINANNINIFFIFLIPYSASWSVSPVLIRTTFSKLLTKILPSPTFPVLAVLLIASITAGIVSVLWLIVGYSIAFADGNAYFGSLSIFMLSGVLEGL
jgi:hypothetical protein